MKPKRTILCVDDDERSLSIQKIMLETRGYRVLTCSDPEQAIGLVKAGGVDLILADLMMPKMSGGRMIDEMKAISPQTPAILFSGAVKFCAEDTHADVFLPKGSYPPVELLERIRVMLVRKRGPKRATVPVTLSRTFAS